MENNKLFCVSKKLTEASISCLTQLCKNPDAEVRLEAAETLLTFPYMQTENIFLQLLHDSDALVQCQACDALSLGKSEQVLNSLTAAAIQNQGMVRGYAIISLADVQRNLNTCAEETIGFLQDLLDCEKDDWVRIAIYRSLITLGMDEYMPMFLAGGKDSDYHNRCLMLNLLEEILDEGLYKQSKNIQAILNDMLAVENSLAVKENIQRVLGKM